MNKALLFALLVMPLAHAESDVCSDLYSFTCSAGKFDDGTGVEDNARYDNTSLINLINGSNAKMKEQLKKTLADPDNTYFRKLALAGTLANGNPECDGAEDHPSAKCVDILAEGTAALVLQQTSGMPGLQQVYGAAQSDPTLADKKYLTEAPEFHKAQADLLASMKESVGQAAVEKKISEDIFPKIRSLLISKVEDTVKDPVVKKNMIDKLRGLRFSGSGCVSPGVNPQSISGAFLPVSYYEPEANDYHYCLGMAVEGDSEFTLAYEVAHQLAHAIDPFRATLGPSSYALHYKPSDSMEELDAQFPFGELLKCLRSDASIGAKSIQHAFGLNPYVAPKIIKPAPGPIVPPPPATPEKKTKFSDADQVLEGFAQWMAAEVLPEYIQSKYPGLTQKQFRTGYANVNRGMVGRSCQVPDRPMDPNPPMRVRINNELLMQPDVRKQMGCSPTVAERTHCSPNWKPGDIAPAAKPTSDSGAQHD